MSNIGMDEHQLVSGQFVKSVVTFGHPYTCNMCVIKQEIVFHTSSKHQPLVSLVVYNLPLPNDIISLMWSIFRIVCPI